MDTLFTPEKCCPDFSRDLHHLIGKDKPLKVCCGAFFPLKMSTAEREILITLKLRGFYAKLPEVMPLMVHISFFILFSILYKSLKSFIGLTLFWGQFPHL